MGGDRRHPAQPGAAAGVTSLSPWPEGSGARRVVDALGGSDAARLVGGVVRDRLLGVEAADVDVATVHPPQEARRLLKAAGLDSVPTGIAHGTITALSPDGPIEVTTLRHDVETDGRHATVAFTDDWRADAARRDFTMNALYAEADTGRVHDYHGGRADLEAGRVRFIGDPAQRIAEDRLRVLRFFRFTARFGRAPDAEGLAACAAAAGTLDRLSVERVAAELIRLLALPAPGDAVALMLGAGVLADVLPEARDVASYRALLAAEDAAGVARSAMRGLAALLPADPALAERVARRLKLSKADRTRLVAAADRATGASLPTLLHRFGREGTLDRLLLTGAPTERVREAMTAPLPDFVLKGRDAIALGVEPGPAVSRLLRETEARWLVEGLPDEARQRALLAEVMQHG